GARPGGYLGGGPGRRWLRRQTEGTLRECDRRNRPGGGPEQDHRTARRGDRAGTPEGESDRPERISDCRRVSQRGGAGVGLLAHRAGPDREFVGRELRIMATDEHG